MINNITIFWGIFYENLMFQWGGVHCCPMYTIITLSVSSRAVYLPCKRVAHEEIFGALQGSVSEWESRTLHSLWAAALVEGSFQMVR